MIDIKRRENIEKITNDYMECKAVKRRLESDNDQLKKDILDLRNQVIRRNEQLNWIINLTIEYLIK